MDQVGLAGRDTLAVSGVRGEPRHWPPRSETFGRSGAAPWTKVGANDAAGGREVSGVRGRFEAAPPSPAFARGLMRLLPSPKSESLFTQGWRRIYPPPRSPTGRPPEVRRCHTSISRLVIATATGPRISPEAPNSASPPRTAKKTTRVCIRSLSPTNMG
jgi:hypothetical protein